MKGLVIKGRKILKPDMKSTWKEFTERLCQKVFKVDPKHPDDVMKDRLMCRHDFRFTRQVFKDMDLNIDREGTLEWFRAHGGYCDCEVLFNVDPH